MNNIIDKKQTFNFLNTRKGDIFYKCSIVGNELRYVVVDYDYNNVHFIDLNSDDTEYKKIFSFSFEELNSKNFDNERLIVRPRYLYGN